MNVKAFLKNVTYFTASISRMSARYWVDTIADPHAVSIGAKPFAPCPLRYASFPFPIKNMP
jgi:hypothetical protein